MIERSSVPVNDVVESLMLKRNLKVTKTQFPITPEEIWSCVEYAIDCKPAGANEYIKFDVHTDLNGELCVNTESMTDWVYLNSILYGRMFSPDEHDLNKMYAVGLENIMREILEDLLLENEDFTESALHNIVYKSFIDSYGDLDTNDVQYLLASLNGTYRD